MSGSHLEMTTLSNMHRWDRGASFRIWFKWKYKTLRLHQCLTLSICHDAKEVFLVFGCLMKQHCTWETEERARRGTQTNKNPLNYQELRQIELLTTLKTIRPPNNRPVYTIVTEWKAEQQGPRLHQGRACSNVTAMSTAVKKQLTFSRPQAGRDLQQDTLTCTASS